MFLKFQNPRFCFNFTFILSKCVIQYGRSLRMRGVTERLTKVVADEGCSAKFDVKVGLH